MLQEALNVLDAGCMADHSRFLLGQKFRKTLYVHLQLRTTTSTSLLTCDWQLDTIRNNFIKTSKFVFLVWPKFEPVRCSSILDNFFMAFCLHPERRVKIDKVSGKCLGLDSNLDRHSPPKLCLSCHTQHPPAAPILTWTLLWVPFQSSWLVKISKDSDLWMFFSRAGMHVKCEPPGTLLGNISAAELQTDKHPTPCSSSRGGHH